MMGDQQITTSRRLILNTAFNLITLLSGAAVGFLLIGFFLSELGEMRYGIWILVGSIFQYRRLLDMGMNSSINRYIPVGLATGDNAAIQRVLSTSLFFFSVLAVVFILISLAIYSNLGSWFTITSDMLGTAGVLVLVVGSCFAIAMPLQLSSALLSGLQRYDILNIAELVALLLRTVLVVVLLRQGFGLITMGLVFGASEILVRVLQFIFARKLLPEASITLEAVDIGLLREMLSYGINTFLYTMAGVILFKASDVVIAVFIGTREVSQFAVAVAGIILLSQFLRAFTAAIKPAVSDLDARDDQSRVLEISFLMRKYSLLVIMPAACFLIVMGRNFLQVWVGNKFEQPTVIETMSLVLAILTFGHCMRLAQHSNFIVLVGKGEHKIFGIFTVVMAFLCVSASVISVTVFNLGLVGIAWSNCLPMALMCGIVLPIYFNRKMGISVRDSISRIWWPAMLGSTPAVVMIIGWKQLYPPMDWFGIGTVVVCSVLLTCLSAWCLSLTPLERNRLTRILPRSVLRFTRHVHGGFFSVIAESKNAGRN